MSRRDDLIALIKGCDLEMPAELNDDTPLVGSGAFDSLVLFQLVIWVEKQVGSPIDPSEFDVASEWDTLGDVLRFVEKHNSNGTRPGDRL